MEHFFVIPNPWTSSSFGWSPLRSPLPNVTGPLLWKQVDVLSFV